jgi:RNA polymerase sigma-70 factor (ECF subfamily)
MTLRKRENNRNLQILKSNELPEIANQELFSFQDKYLEELYTAIKQLSELNRAIIVLHLEEKSYKEIAFIIGTNSNNIGVRIQRIKKKLKQLIFKQL